MDDNLYTASDGSALRFFEDAKPNNAATERCGRAIFDQCLMVEVITPGQRESAPIFELERKFADEVGIRNPRRSAKYAQYRPQIDAYLSGNESSDMRGTPLSSWPAASTSLVATAKHAGIFTVEALAALPDSRLSALGPGALSLRARAVSFLAAADGNADSEANAAELLTAQGEIERLNKEVASLNERLTAALADVQRLSAGGQPETPPPPPPPPPVEAPLPPPPIEAPKPKVNKTGGNTMQPII